MLAGHDDLGDLEGRDVAEGEAGELAGLVQRVHGLEGLGEGDAAVRDVQVEDVDAVGAELAQARLDLVDQGVALEPIRG